MKYSIKEILQISAATLFLCGAIFMLVNTFADQIWAFWVGLGFALMALGVYVALVIKERKLIFQKISAYSAKKSSTNEHDKSNTTQTVDTQIGVPSDNK